jgi:hypothetical protein
MRLDDRYREIAHSNGEIEHEGVRYTITGRGEQTNVEHFEVSFRSRHDVMVELWCFFERRLLGSRRFACKITVDTVEVQTISDTTELSGPPRIAIEGAFKALDSYMADLQERRKKNAAREQEKRRTALDKL